MEQKRSFKNYEEYNIQYYEEISLDNRVINLNVQPGGTAPRHRAELRSGLVRTHDLN